VTVAFFGLFVSFPFEVLALGTILYLATIPFGAARYRQLHRAQPNNDAPLPSAPEMETGGKGEGPAEEVHKRPALD
jgi:CDP-diacylglycerol---serine O-phosphatidyltransferase